MSIITAITSGLVKSNRPFSNSDGLAPTGIRKFNTVPNLTLDQKQTRLSELVKDTTPRLAFRLPEADNCPIGKGAVAIMGAGAPVDTLAQAYLKAYPGIRIVQIKSAEHPQSQYATGGCINLDGDAILCYQDGDQILAKIDNFNTNKQFAEGSVVYADPIWGGGSENHEFAKQFEDAGIVWGGPSSQAIIDTGHKVRLKQACLDAGIPTTPFLSVFEGEGAIDLQASTNLIKGFIEQHRHDQDQFIFFIKVPLGGGGKGIKKVVVPADQALDSAFMSTVQNHLQMVNIAGETSCGEGDVFVEAGAGQKTPPRHIEKQVLASKDAANIVQITHPDTRPINELRVQVVGGRDCSIQDPHSHQKAKEIAPDFAPPEGLTKEQSQLLDAQTKRIVELLGYDNVGTVEWLTDFDENGDFTYELLEVNPRKQVEHPLTEYVTFLTDSATGKTENLNIPATVMQTKMWGMNPPSDDQVEVSGVAIQNRLVARMPQLPTKGPWIPQPGNPNSITSGGRNSQLVLPGYEGQPTLDSQFGSLFVHTGRDGTWEQAIGLDQEALKALNIGGLYTTAPTLAAISKNPNWIAGRGITTGFLNNNPNVITYINNATPMANVVNATHGALTTLAANDGFTRAGKTNKPNATEAQLDTFYASKATVESMPKKTTPAMAAYKEGGWKATIQHLLNPDTKENVLWRRDEHQADKSSALTPESWAVDNATTDAFAADAGFSFREGHGGAGSQSYEIYHGGSGMRQKATCVSDKWFNTHLSRTEYQESTQKLTKAQRAFYKRVETEEKRKQLGLPDGAEVPDIEYTFFAGNVPSTVIQCTKETNDAGRIGIPTVCLGEKQDPELSYKIAKEIAEGLVGNDKHDRQMMYLKEPCGYDVTPEYVESHVLAVKQAYRDATREAYGEERELVVMFHQHDTNKRANDIATHLRVQNIPGLILGGSVGDTHARFEHILKVSGKTSEQIEAYRDARVHYDAIDDLRGAYKADFRTDHGLTMPGGMGSSAYYNLITAGIDPVNLSKVYNLGLDTVRALVEVTPYSQYNLSAGVKLWLQGYRTVEDVKQALDKGIDLHLPDDVMTLLVNWETESVYPESPFRAQIIANFKGTIPAPVDQDASFDPEAVRDELAAKVGLDRSHITDRDIADCMISPQHAPNNIVARHHGTSMDHLPDWAYFGDIKPGILRPFQIDGVTHMVELVSLSNPNGKGMVQAVWKIDGKLVIATAKNTEAAKKTAGVSNVTKADPNNPLHIGAPMAGQIVKLQVEAGDEVKANDLLAVLSAMKMENSINAPEATDGETYKVGTIHAKKDEPVEEGQLLVELIAVPAEKTHATPNGAGTNTAAAAIAAGNNRGMATWAGRPGLPFTQNSRVQFQSARVAYRLANATTKQTMTTRLFSSSSTTRQAVRSSPRHARMAATAGLGATGVTVSMMRGTTKK